jgi:histidinol-phosphate aminotransferase
MPPLPRAAGAGFQPYVWAATAADIAARHGLSPAHVLRFDANLPPFPARLAVSPRRALASRSEYPEGTYRELREAAAAYVGCTPDAVAVDAGADGAIALVARTFLGPGRRAVTEERTYPLYAIASRIEGADVETAPRDLDALAAAARTAAVVWLCNPGNPGGEILAADEIAGLARSLPATLVCVDEAYAEYGGETAVPAALELENLVCVRTLSKVFGFAGLRVGFAVATPRVATDLTARRSPAPISTTSAALATEALRRGEIEPELRATTSERQRVRAALAAAGFDAPTTHTNFVVVRTPDAEALADGLERRGLVVRAYPDLIRITVRSPADDDLLLLQLGVDAPPAATRAATVLAPGVRVSLVLDGSGRATSATGDEARDRRIEDEARDEGVDLELVADPERTDEEVVGALTEARGRALAYPGSGKGRRTVCRG